MTKLEELFYFLNGWQDASGADEMSDGAWQCVMMEGVEAFNEENGTKFDPHEGWLEWAQWEAPETTPVPPPKPKQPKVACDQCGKKVAPSGMRQHTEAKHPKEKENA